MQTVIMHGLENSKSGGDGERMPHQSRRPAAVSKSTASTEDTACGGIVARESVTLCVIITTVCTLLTLPVIFYHLPLRVQQPGVSSYYVANI